MQKQVKFQTIVTCFKNGSPCVCTSNSFVLTIVGKGNVNNVPSKTNLIRVQPNQKNCCCLKQEKIKFALSLLFCKF